MSQTLKNFTPTRDWLLLPDPRVMEKSGIILDEKTAASLQTNISKVLAVGPDCKEAKKGSTVMINPTTTGNIVEIDNKSYIMIPEHFCMGVFN
jgi:co-chaperonin GroES (HSP10)